MTTDDQLQCDIIQQLRVPETTSHKGQNGVLYCIAGSTQYHGSLWYAIEVACHFIDVIYVETDTSNNQLVTSLKQLHPAIILVDPQLRSEYLAKSDCVLLGPGLGRTEHAQKLVRDLLHHKHRPAKVIIDADALHYIHESDITADVVVTPHAAEYKALFGEEACQQVAQRVAGVIVQKGSTDVICQNQKIRYNTHGNPGLTKGGSGDVLAALIAALACTNPVWLASCAAVVCVGQSAEDLALQRGTTFSIQELIDQIPITYYTCQQPPEKNASIKKR